MVNILLILMLISAAAAVFSRDNMTSILALGTTGIFICMTAAFIGSPAVALAQLSLEMILLFLLVELAGKNRERTKDGGKLIFQSITALFAFMIFLFLSYFVSAGLPDFGIDFIGPSEILRSYDTIGIIACVFASMVGVSAILRKKGRK